MQTHRIGTKAILIKALPKIIFHFHQVRVRRICSDLEQAVKTAERKIILYIINFFDILPITIGLQCRSHIIWTILSE